MDILKRVPVNIVLAVLDTRAERQYDDVMVLIGGD